MRHVDYDDPTRTHSLRDPACRDYAGPPPPVALTWLHTCFTCAGKRRQDYLEMKEIIGHG